jgi:hypothetical protein
MRPINEAIHTTRTRDEGSPQNGIFQQILNPDSHARLPDTALNQGGPCRWKESGEIGACLNKDPVY